MQNPGMIYGYARVSTVAQDLASQLAQLKAAGCEKVFREKVTGTTADRPQLKKPMAVLAPGDVVITTAVDRLSRDTTDRMVIAREMPRAGAGLRSLAEQVVVSRRPRRNAAQRRPQLQRRLGDDFETASVTAATTQQGILPCWM
jgi:DNA invertase Pin-like site-specific DNA recombinase